MFAGLVVYYARKLYESFMNMHWQSTNKLLMEKFQSELDKGSCSSATGDQNRSFCVGFLFDVHPIEIDKFGWIIKLLVTFDHLQTCIPGR